MAAFEEYTSNLPWHTISAQETLKKLHTSELGVTQTEANKRYENHGPNRLEQGVGRNPIVRFLSHFHNILIYVLIASAVITSLLGHWIDSGVILTVVVANAVIGFIQEGKAEQAMSAIRHMLAPQANVIRDGQRITIDGEKLIPGDMVLLEAGDKVPADLRLCSAHNFYVQEAILTGESVPVGKNTDAVDENSSLGDRSCMAFSGTLVTSGQCKGIVVATGSDTEIGRISGLLDKVETLTTPLVSQMGVFAKWLTIFILVIAALLVVFGTFVANYEFTEMFMAVVGLSVAAIPEGLPAVLTITLAIGVQAMARRNAIVRRLPAIETLGSVSVICTDKTGTLTRNEMMVSSILTHKHLFNLTGNGYEPKGTLTLNNNAITPDEHSMLEEIARASALCNDAALNQKNHKWYVEGDPMEGALLAFAGKMELDVHQERALWTRTDAIPFDAKYRFMATLNHDHQQHAFVFIKGAPEQILAMCKNQRAADGSTETLDRNYWEAQSEAIAAQGQRVLGFAIKSLPTQHTVLEHQDICDSATLLGLVGMMDPPRQEAIEAVAQCHRAGIQVKMITGDHTKTAAAIGKQIGLENVSKVLTGADLDKLDDGALQQAVKECDIFARTSPEHKLRLVMALQSHGLTVAMTGDGVNDAPALKRADAGIAMGQKGSEAAKEAADLVLADDNFTSIVAAVAQGRTVYDNLKKVISWTLPTNAGEAMTIIVALLMGMTLPVTPIQILWINLVTAITLGVVLAFEPTEDDTMLRLPRNRNEPLLNAGLIWHVIFVSLLFLCGVFGIYQYAIDKGYAIELARTMALNTLVVMEIFHLFFIRNIYGTSLTWKAIRGTKFVWLVILVITLAQFSITYISPLQKVFDTESIPFLDGLIIFAVGVALFTIIEIEKQLRLAFKNAVK
ncbi:cation-transporting P-type ATPase [Aliiglaciecola sp. 3_MG-2023]|uniref:cation-transporting P-type ATPase n=1 Tax=Aliiglaciecola sp. 3_MG-2023 TaxID=3062644 RepID=UPI0026E41905|nr:cation-transporting P-type ATPase [Aliiglaciecola sp. 3_MG-2023]MDO6692554.1 cation-transporting P-type ATPase [Aliiglaciecola sp. 3_MG-2023]